MFHSNTNLSKNKKLKKSVESGRFHHPGYGKIHKISYFFCFVTFKPSLSPDPVNPQSILFNKSLIVVILHFWQGLGYVYD